MASSPPPDAPLDRAALLALDDDAVAALAFEQAYGALDAVVDLLESGDLPLEDALALYERGVALSRRCGRELEAAELRVREVNGAGEDAGAVSS